MIHYSAFGQFSTTLQEPPTEPTTTTPLSQNTTSSSVDEGVIISSLVFEPDGTGWLMFRLNNNGTVGPMIPFTHNFTEANGRYHKLPAS